MSALGWLATAAGAALILASLRDVFHTLLHPSGIGQLSPLVFRGMWRLTQRLGGGWPRIAGPAGVATTVLAWTAMLALGFALLYTPHLPESFRITQGVDAADQDGVLDGLYLSVTALSTLGFGDIVARTPSLRLLLVGEALIGFALLTASISWILSVYPALARRRTLAARIANLVEGEGPGARLVGWDSPATLAPVVHSVAEQLSAVRVDLLQFPSTFFFEPPDHDLSLPVALARVRTILGRDDIPPSLDPAVRELRQAMRGLGRTLQRPPFDLPGDDADAALDAYLDRRIR